MSNAGLLQFPLGKIAGSISFNLQRSSVAIQPSILWILGLSRFEGDERGLQSAFMELVHHDYHYDMQEAFNDAVKAESVLVLAYPVLDRYKNWRRVRFAGFWTRDVEGRIECMVGHLSEVGKKEMFPAEEICNSALRIRELSVRNRFLPLAHMSDLMLLQLEAMAREKPNRGLYQ